MAYVASEIGDWNSLVVGLEKGNTNREQRWGEDL